ncbi:MULTISPECIES: diguanylate cyclase [Anaeromyxobacter]|uniref:sensor domain-containing diguanylate cyclase n=1 Tax=Anaeromyxobacter TaxID=161492 RepID=UPI001F55DAB8|nr:MULTISPECIES: diguanylate cyclase [unclassified Anaeromyxobacter]
MLRSIRRSIGRKLLIAVGAPGLLFSLAVVLWLRHESRALAPAVEPLHRIALVALVVLAAGLAAMHLVVVRYVVDRRLRRLAAGMRRAREGDFLHRVPDEGEDEIGQVASTYNETLAAITDLHVRRIEDAASIASMERELSLKAELEARVRELTLLFELGRTLGATLDLDELVRATAAQVGSALGAAELQVLLVDEATGERVVRAAYGSDGAAVGTRLPPGQARPGWLEVPMARGEEGAGAIALRPAGGGLSPQERRLLEAIAAQSAIAVANARLHQKMVRLSQTDALTGAHNRRSLFARLEDELERSARFDHATAVALVDVDHFRRYNEAFGHASGDTVLRRVAAVLGGAARKVDVVARYGGEEFAVVLARADRAAALVAAEKLRAAVTAAAIPHPGVGPGHVTISVGVAIYPDDARDLGALIDCADGALYAAKRAGRNVVMPYAPGMRDHPGRKRDQRSASDADAGELRPGEGSPPAAAAG